MNLREELFANQDLKYRAFHKKLVPNISEDVFIGVRVPVLRKMAVRANKENAENLCEYYEEKMIKGFVIGLKKCPLDEHIDDLRAFVPLIDNWAVCDCCCSSFKFTNKYKNEMYDFIVSYLDKCEYETRFAVIMLMDYYLDDDYIDRVLDIYSSIKSEYYYVNMAVAWALSVAFTKYRDKVLKIIESKTMTKDIQNKTIQKIRESNRIDKADKDLVRNYKIA